jgi:muramoyltetrapeptide carboxypeptidase LdcA involved in peptidoglycan recycling
MFETTEEYFKNSINYIDSLLQSIKSGMIETKEVIVVIGNAISTVVSIFGFIGFRVFILLMVTSFIIWILNLASPSNKKTNYILSVGIVIWLAINAKMPLQIVVLKYLLIILLPLLIVRVINFLNENIYYVFGMIIKKINKYLEKIDFYESKLIINQESLNVGLLFTSDLPKIEELDNLKKKVYYIILESERISLTDNQNRIIFGNELKYLQLIKSMKDKNINLLWFWSEFYGANEILKDLEKTKKIKQKHYIIGNGDNSFILNFLQEKWNWKVIHGVNLKYADSINLSEISEYTLSLINDFSLTDDWFLRVKIVGSDLSVLVNQIGSYNKLSFKDKILFFDGVVENETIFYRYINQLQNRIIKKKHYPKAIILGNLISKDNMNVASIIKNFSDSLKENCMPIPIFQNKNIKFLVLNDECIIEYKQNQIKLSSHLEIMAKITPKTLKKEENLLKIIK